METWISFQKRKPKKKSYIIVIDTRDPHPSPLLVKIPKGKSIKFLESWTHWYPVPSLNDIEGWVDISSD